MFVLKKCPICNSSRISGGIEFIKDRYFQNIQCKKCGYKNKKPIT